MPLTQKHHSSIFQTLSPVLGVEEAEALLSQFPGREVDELVTHGHLRAGLAEVRAEIAVVRTEVAGVRTEVAELRADVFEQLHRQTVWFAGAMVGGLALSATIASAIASAI